MKLSDSKLEYFADALKSIALGIYGGTAAAQAMYHDRPWIRFTMDALAGTAILIVGGWMHPNKSGKKGR